MIVDKIKTMEDEIAVVEAIIRPKVVMASELEELLRKAEESYAYTGRRNSPRVTIHAYTKEKTIAEISIDASYLLKCAKVEIESGREAIKASKDKIAEIEAILKD